MRKKEPMIGVTVVATVDLQVGLLLLLQPKVNVVEVVADHLMTWLFVNKQNRPSWYRGERELQPPQAAIADMEDNDTEEPKYRVDFSSKIE